jgi:hypothetical protein
MPVISGIFLIKNLMTMKTNENAVNEIQENQNGRLTVSKLRTYPGCEHYSDEEAEKVVQSLRQLSEIIANTPQIKNHLIDNQLVVYLSNDKNRAA